MSITVRRWTTEELEATKHDKWLATLLMNGKTFSTEEMRYYPYNQRRTYLCEWGNDTATIYATDERMLKRFIEAEYTRPPFTINQVVTQYRPVKIFHQS